MAIAVIVEHEGGWYDGYIDYRVSHRSFRVHPSGEVTGRLGYIVDETELRLIREAVARVSKPSTEPSPMTRFKSGAPRANMHHFYFGGYYYFGLYDAKLGVTYRPTDISDEGKTSETHMKMWYPR